MTKTTKNNKNINNNIYTKFNNNNKYLVQKTIGLESVTFESFKPLFLTSLFASKARKLNTLTKTAVTADKACLYS